MYLGNFDYLNSFTCVNEHCGTERMGKTRTNSNITRGVGEERYITGKAQRLNQV